MFGTGYTNLGPRPCELLAYALTFLFLVMAPRLAQADEPSPVSPPPAPLSFNRDIHPILSNNCFKCHGPDSGARQAGLRLDRPADATAELESGAVAIVPGNAEQSALVARIASADDSQRMPPHDSNKVLSDVQKDLLRRWIAEGARWEPHWSHMPLIRPSLSLDNDRSSDSPIDEFLLARLDREGLAPSHEADRRTLIRRLSLDLIGLPPTVEEVEAFAADHRPEAYERLVDRLLASPHFGERMAIYWLDLVRYGDTVGYHGDQEMTISPYRDYVIEAFNRNLPFDRFTIEQLAGDLLPEPTESQRIASGFNRLNMTTEEGGAQAGEYLAKYAADRVRAVSTVWMGATLGCAECHDHKFDPYTTKDFYSFAAFFADLDEVGVYGGGGKRPPEMQTADGRATLVSAALPEPRVVRILPRGDWLDESGEVVLPAVPECFGPLDLGGRRATRLDLARWLVSGEHPQTARVLANRLWKLFFGAGLSSTLDDCGVQGEWPRHPELLDWLAAEIVESGWDVKHIVRAIVTSAAYRRSSQAAAELTALDPANRLVARQSHWRIDAEIVRDNALSLAGLLVRQFGEVGVRPYQPAGYYSHLNFPLREYVNDEGARQYRRGVYMHWQRTFLHPALLAFDAPSREECAAQRPVSNTPKAALVLLNDPTYVEAARGFAARMIREGGATPQDRIAWAFRQAVARSPEMRETAILADLQARHLAHYREHPEAAAELISTGLSAVPADLDPAELAAWTSVARAILNLDETITRY